MKADCQILFPNLQAAGKPLQLCLATTLMKSQQLSNVWPEQDSTPGCSPSHHIPIPWRYHSEDLLWTYPSSLYLWLASHTHRGLTLQQTNRHNANTVWNYLLVVIYILCCNIRHNGWVSCSCLCFGLCVQYSLDKQYLLCTINTFKHWRTE